MFCFLPSRVSLLASALTAAMISGACKGPASPTAVPTGDSTYLTFESKPGDGIGNGQSRRFDDDNATFATVTDQYEVVVQIRESSGTRWELQMAASPGVKLTPGSYEITDPTAPYFRTGPYLSFSGNGLGCIPVGRFTVHTAQYGPGAAVSRFHATFEQRCPSSPQGLTGEVFIAQAPGRADVPNIAGTWSGRLEADVFTSTQVVLNQSGPTVTGTWSAAGTNWFGSLEGTVREGTFTGTVTFSGLYPLHNGSQCSGSAPVAAFLDEGVPQLVLRSQSFRGSCQYMPYSLLWVLQQRRSS